MTDVSMSIPRIPGEPPSYTEAMLAHLLSMRGHSGHKIACFLELNELDLAEVFFGNTFPGSRQKASEIMDKLKPA